jgi:hypothetical protein
MILKLQGGSMKKFISLLLTFVFALSLVAGASTPTETEEPVTDNETEELVYSDELRINFAMGNNARTMTYQKADPLTLPDGTTVVQGDLKPTWQYIQSQLGFTIVDTAVQDQKATEMIDFNSSTSFDDATIFGGNSIASNLMNYGAQGYFINLKDYLDQMPNVKAYLEANPNVAKAITAHDGGIYHLPYVAEIDNYARVYNGRADWVMALLDSTDMLETETETLNVSYTGYWDRHETNVITLQNEAASNGVLSQATALQVLVDYIKATYPELEKPSDLYIGGTAMYDIDELVALWRVVELSPATLSKVSTGTANPAAEISAYFVRKSKYREDTLRLLNHFDGERVHASDSYGATLFYFDGEMNYTYASDGFLDKLDYVKAMFDEGLIHSEFADLSVTDEFRKSMFFADDAEGQSQFGFMTFDWIASTTNGSEKITSFLPPVTTISDAGINDFVHYVENTRAIKPDGWSISAKADEANRNSALKLFDYMFSEEGNVAQNYSIPGALNEGGVFVGADGTEYPEFSQWLLDTAGEMKNGDVSGFLRDFMGSHLALGYQKEIGFELQYTSANGFAGWDLYTTKDVLTMSYGTDNNYLRMMPPLISLNDQEVAKLDTVAVGSDQTDQLFLYITNAESAPASADAIRTMFVDAGIEKFLDIYQGAYERMNE